MKRIRCPKCDESILFDENLYEAGRVLIFECPECHKQFKVRIPMPKPQNAESQDANDASQKVYAKLIVLENAFHFKQEIPLFAGENTVGRFVRGTRANAAIKTVDPSMDTTHCVITVTPRTDGTARFTLRDAPSNTGTFLQNEILGDKDRVNIGDGDIITLGATTMVLRVE